MSGPIPSIGDITPFDNVSSEEKLIRGREAVKLVLKGLVKKDEYEALLEEFNAHYTNESKFAYMCDKLECDIWMKVYEDYGYNDINQSNLKPLKSVKIKEIVANGENKIANIFIEFDRDKYKDNIVFLNLLDYIKNNNLKNLNKVT